MVALRKSIFLFVLMSMSLIVFGCSLLSSANEVPDVPVEMITNGDFELVDEDGFPEGGHRRIGGAEIYADDSVARSGKYSLYIGKASASATDGFGVGTSMSGPIFAGKTYQLSVWHRAPEMVVDGKLPLLLRVLASGIPADVGGFQADWIHPIGVDATYKVTTVDKNAHMYIRTSVVADMDPDAWHQILVKVTMPIDLTRFTINFYNESTEYPVWIDDISLLEMN